MDSQSTTERSTVGYDNLDEMFFPFRLILLLPPDSPALQSRRYRALSIPEARLGGKMAVVATNPRAKHKDVDPKNCISDGIGITLDVSLIELLLRDSLGETFRLVFEKTENDRSVKKDVLDAWRKHYQWLIDSLPTMVPFKISEYAGRFVYHGLKLMFDRIVFDCLSTGSPTGDNKGLKRIYNDIAASRHRDITFELRGGPSTTLRHIRNHISESQYAVDVVSLHPFWKWVCSQKNREEFEYWAEARTASKFPKLLPEEHTRESAVRLLKSLDKDKIKKRKPLQLALRHAASLPGYEEIADESITYLDAMYRRGSSLEAAFVRDNQSSHETS